MTGAAGRDLRSKKNLPDPSHFFPPGFINIPASTKTRDFLRQDARKIVKDN
ncbi:MAG: hypothetical protein ACREE1_15000 [Stellaceae bacterium]